VSTRRSLAIAALLATWASVAHSEDGPPGVDVPFDEGDVVPTNVLVPLRGVNGVPFGLAELEALEPRLVSSSSSIPLRVVDSFDDLEGHAVPFPSDGGGYGENLILLAPRFRLAAGTRYAFTIGTGSAAASYFRFSTGSTPDLKGPEWQKSPYLDLATPEADEPLLPSRIVTAVAESSELPLYFIVELEPREAQARPKRMIAMLNLPSASAAHCGFADVWDHAHGVYSEDTDSDLGRRYVATLTAVDAAGNRRRAPGSGIPIVWSGGVAVCNEPGSAQPADMKPPPPQWLEAPSLSSNVDKDFNPSSDRGTAYEHTLKLAVETAAVVAVELTLRRSKEPFTTYRRVGLLGPTKRAAPDKTASRASIETCVEPLITNTDREKPMPSETEPLSLTVALIDPLGRRLEHRGPALTVSHLHPERSHIRVCARGNATK